MNPARDLPLLAAWRLRVPGRLLRPLARGDHAPLRAWLAAEPAVRLAEARRDARADLGVLERLGAHIVTPDDRDWPAGFGDLRDPPAFLAVRGTLPAGGVAIVGARDASERACAFAGELAARLGVAVVSGLAHGVDAAAHRGALAARIPTVAYVGTGLARTFPPDHVGLADAIAASGGGIAAESPPDDDATPWSLRRRDRLQAAHARAVVVVESDAAGGAMHTLRFARELGRPRLAVNAEASGNHSAIADGAVRLPWDVDAAVRRILDVIANDGVRAERE